MSNTHTHTGSGSGSGNDGNQINATSSSSSPSSISLSSSLLHGSQPKAQQSTPTTASPNAAATSSLITPSSGGHNHNPSHGSSSGGMSSHAFPGMTTLFQALPTVLPPSPISQTAPIPSMALPAQPRAVRLAPPSLPSSMSVHGHGHAPATVMTLNNLASMLPVNMPLPAPAVPSSSLATSAATTGVRRGSTDGHMDTTSDESRRVNPPSSTPSLPASIPSRLPNVASPSAVAAAVAAVTAGTMNGNNNDSIPANMQSSSNKASSAPSSSLAAASSSQSSPLLLSDDQLISFKHAMESVPKMGNEWIKQLLAMSEAEEKTLGQYQTMARVISSMLSQLSHQAGGNIELTKRWRHDAQMVVNDCITRMNGYTHAYEQLYQRYEISRQETIRLQRDIVRLETEKKQLRDEYQEAIRPTYVQELKDQVQELEEKYGQIHKQNLLLAAQRAGSQHECNDGHKCCRVIREQQNDSRKRRRSDDDHVAPSAVAVPANGNGNGNGNTTNTSSSSSPSAASAARALAYGNRRHGNRVVSHDDDLPPLQPAEALRFAKQLLGPPLSTPQPVENKGVAVMTPLSMLLPTLKKARAPNGSSSMVVTPANGANGAVSRPQPSVSSASKTNNDGHSNGNGNGSGSGSGSGGNGSDNGINVTMHHGDQDDDDDDEIDDDDSGTDEIGACVNCHTREAVRQTSCHHGWVCAQCELLCTTCMGSSKRMISSSSSSSSNASSASSIGARAHGSGAH